MKYVHFTKLGKIIDTDTDEVVYPLTAYNVEANRIYMEYVDGGGIIYANHEPIVPEKVAMSAMKAYLELNGMLVGIVNFIDSLPAQERIIAKNYWTESTHLERASPLLNKFMVELGYTDETMDNIFISAEDLYNQFK